MHSAFLSEWALPSTEVEPPSLLKAGPIPIRMPFFCLWFSTHKPVSRHSLPSFALSFMLFPLSWLFTFCKFNSLYSDVRASRCLSKCYNIVRGSVTVYVQPLSLGDVWLSMYSLLASEMCNYLCNSLSASEMCNYLCNSLSASERLNFP